MTQMMSEPPRGPLSGPVLASPALPPAGVPGTRNAQGVHCPALGPECSFLASCSSLSGLP